MNQLGSVGLIAALAFAAYAVVAGAVGGKLRSSRVTRSAERATLAFFVMITLAVVALEYLILTNDFHNAYVAEHSNRDLLHFLQSGGALGGPGRLAAFLDVAAFDLQRLGRAAEPQEEPPADALCGCGADGHGRLLFFLGAFCCQPLSRAFARLAAGTQPFTPPDGNGLNPLLQYHSMVIHPPMLYLGYVGMVVPFAFAMAALITRQLGDNWIRTTRRWTMVPWMLLGLGILLGGNWAYAVLGWGGYWGWDPVENASLLPWLSGTAFLHSVMIQEKRGMLKVWNVVLVITTFFLSIFGTFLTRSGIVSSVHAFAQSNIGPFFAVFLSIIVFFSVTLAFPAPGSSQEREQARFPGFPRERLPLQQLDSAGAGLRGPLGNVVPADFQGGAECDRHRGRSVLQQDGHTHGPAAPLSDRRGSAAGLAEDFLPESQAEFTLPLIVALVAGAILFVAGVRHFYAWMTLFLSVFVVVCILGEFWKGARTRMKTAARILLRPSITSPCGTRGVTAVTSCTWALCCSLSGLPAWPSRRRPKA